MFYVLETATEKFALLVHPSANERTAQGALTVAEQRVLALALEGLSNEEIAQRRNIAKRTVVNQLSTIYRKLGVRSRRELKASFVALPVI